METAVKSLKPAKSYPEQVALLRSRHGLIIEDQSEAIHILSTVNYYRLMGYAVGLIDRETDRFRPGTTFNHLYALYRFDAQLRNLLIPLIEFVEVHFRTSIAHHLAMMYGPEGYTDPSHFSSNTNNMRKVPFHKTFLDNFESEKEKQKKKPIVVHHQTIYGGHFPIWVAVELISFGTLSTLYRAMLPWDQKRVAKVHHTDLRTMRSWFAALVELRNICAHYGRLYNMPLDSTPKLPKDQQVFASTHRLFPAILALQSITRRTEAWRTFKTNLIGLIDNYEDYIQLSYIGFPDNWQTILDAYD